MAKKPNLTLKYFIYGTLSVIFMVTVALRAIDTGSLWQWTAVFLSFCLAIHYLGKMLRSLIKRNEKQETGRNKV